MHKDAAVVVLESLASGVRLDVYRLLVRKGPEGLVASEIAAALDLPPTNLSFHFKALVQAGLLTVKQEGRFQRYRPNLSLMRDLVTYLTAECCGGHPECCVDLLPATTGALAFSQPLESGTSTMNVLFLCTGNSCRSILAEALFNHLAPAGWKAMSAGSQPTGKVHPRSLALLAREGISTDGLYSKSWEDLPRVPDVVITVCSNAAGETCPAYLGPVLRSHWGVEDPAHATGSDEEIDAAFMSAYRILRARVEAFRALALTDLPSDRDRLKAALDRIGGLLP
jgi:arsenate reductase